MVPGRRVRVERLVLPAPDRRLRAASRASPQLAIVLFALVVLFQLVTLPVEFDASRRAKQQLTRSGSSRAGEARRREPGAQRGCADLRRSGVASRLTQLIFLGIRNCRPRNEPARPPCGRLRWWLRAGAVVVALGFVFSLLVHGAPGPGRRSRCEAAPKAAAVTRPPSRRGGAAERRSGRSAPPRRSRHHLGRRRHRDGVDAEPSARRRQVVLRRRADRSRRATSCSATSRARSRSEVAPSAGPGARTATRSTPRRRTRRG